MARKKDWKKLYKAERARLVKIRSEMRSKGFELEIDLPTLKEVEKKGLDYKKLYQSLHKIRGKKKIATLPVAHTETGELFTVKEARRAAREAKATPVFIIPKVIEFIENLPDYRDFYYGRERVTRLDLTGAKARMIQLIQSNIDDYGYNNYDAILDKRYDKISESIDIIIEDSKETRVNNSVTLLFKQLRVDEIMVQDQIDGEDIDSYYESEEF